MNKLLKYTTAIGSATFALAFAVTAASADTSTVNTGDAVRIDSGSTVNTTVRVENNNTATIEQSSFNLSNTGGNYTDGNIGGGSVDTGDAVATSELSASANYSQTEISGLGGTMPSSGDAEIVNTGDDLRFNGGNDYDTRVRVENNNTARIDQTSFNVANTGLNFTGDNIDGGDVETGNAGTSSQFDVEANANHTEVDLDGLYGNGDNDTELYNTGDDVRVNVGDDYETRVRVESNNTVRASQFAMGMANSGLNFSYDNIEGGDVDSGNAVAMSEFDIMANSNHTELDMGGFGAGSNDDVETVNTGDNLVVNSGTTVSSTVAALSNNSTVAAQSSVEVSNSGLNFGLDNIWGGDLDSGNAGAWSDFDLDTNWNHFELD